MIVYTCEDTFEAMMTCIYDAWASKEGHQNIRLKAEPLGTMELFCEYRSVTSDPVKTRKVVRSLPTLWFTAAPCRTIRISWTVSTGFCYLDSPIRHNLPICCSILTSMRSLN